MLKFDIKSLLVGIVVGAVVIFAAGSGAGSADADRFGIAVEFKGTTLVSTKAGDLFVVNPETAMATPVLAAGADAKPFDSREKRANAFNLNASYRARQ